MLLFLNIFAQDIRLKETGKGKNASKIRNMPNRKQHIKTDETTRGKAPNF